MLQDKFLFDQLDKKDKITLDQDGTEIEENECTPYRNAQAAKEISLSRLLQPPQAHASERVRESFLRSFRKLVKHIFHLYINFSLLYTFVLDTEGQSQKRQTNLPTSFGANFYTTRQLCNTAGKLSRRYRVILMKRLPREREREISKMSRLKYILGFGRARRTHKETRARQVREKVSSERAMNGSSCCVTLYCIENLPVSRRSLNIEVKVVRSNGQPEIGTLCTQPPHPNGMYEAVGGDGDGTTCFYTLYIIDIKCSAFALQIHTFRKSDLNHPREFNDVDDVEIVVECEDVKPNINLLAVKKIEEDSQNVWKDMKYNDVYTTQNMIKMDPTEEVQQLSTATTTAADDDVKTEKRTRVCGDFFRKFKTKVLPPPPAAFTAVVSRESCTTQHPERIAEASPGRVRLEGRGQTDVQRDHQGERPGHNLRRVASKSHDQSTQPCPRHRQERAATKDKKSAPAAGGKNENNTIESFV
ncbi:unnamed protein product [Trichogramma brassicae]|uniref:Uncharacterized protein n=1 Tax=Trichogramma brassicae TaxID=86971 RepID=A0A6H5IZJ6_9HYME|nr:unnamed protein product [Trichogramma brassicae]